jgi:D-aminopeptidase
MSFYRTVSILILIGSFGLNGLSQETSTKRARAREVGVQVGKKPTGKWNAITDVPGVMVGHTTLHQGTDIHTGVTVILPHGGNIFQQKVPAAIVVGNGFGKLVGSTQVNELGNIETPIALTSTLSVGPVMNSLVRHTLDLPGNENVRSVNAVVGETNDGYLNDIREFRITEEHVFAAISSAKSGPVEEGSVGAGSGTQCFGFKGGIGTSSRLITTPTGQTYTLGVLVQSNFGNQLKINGAPIGDTPAAMEAARKQPEGDGSCMIVVATDAPMSVRNIERVAQRALHGMARTGSSMSNGSGDYVIAFSTAYRIPHNETELLGIPLLLQNGHMTPFFEAVMDATEEAIYNSLFMATTIYGKNGMVPAINLDAVRDSLRKHNLLLSPAQ